MAAAIRARIENFIAADLLPRLRQVHPGADVTTRAVARVPGLVAEAGSRRPAGIPDPTGRGAAVGAGRRAVTARLLGVVGTDTEAGKTVVAALVVFLVFLRDLPSDRPVPAEPSREGGT